MLYCIPAHSIWALFRPLLPDILLKHTSDKKSTRRDELFSSPQWVGLKYFLSSFWLVSYHLSSGIGQTGAICVKGHESDAIKEDRDVSVQCCA